MQGTLFLSLVQEDPTCLRVTKSTCHNHWSSALEPRATATEPMSYKYWSLHTLWPILHSKRRLCNEKPTHAAKGGLCSPQLEKARERQQRSTTIKSQINKSLKKKFFFKMETKALMSHYPASSDVTFFLIFKKSLFNTLDIHVFGIQK